MIWRWIVVAIVVAVAFGGQPAVRAQLSCGQKMYRYPYIGCGGGVGSGGGGGGCTGALDLSQGCIIPGLG